MHSATWSGASSCTAWPLFGTTCIWNLPCIWPTVRSRSRRSTPARRSNFGQSHDKNSFDKPRERKVFGGGRMNEEDDEPENQPCQKCSVFDRSILQVYRFGSIDRVLSVGTEIFVWSDSSSSSSVTVSQRWERAGSVAPPVADDWSSLDEESTSGWICPMIDTRADSTFRTCPVRTMYSMAFSGLANCFGRELRKHCIELNDSSALPTRTRLGKIRLRQDRRVHLPRHRWHTVHWSSLDILSPRAPREHPLRERTRSVDLRRAWTPTHRVSDEENRRRLILFGIQVTQNLTDVFRQHFHSQISFIGRSRFSVATNVQRNALTPHQTGHGFGENCPTEAGKATAVEKEENRRGGLVGVTRIQTESVLVNGHVTLVVEVGCPFNRCVRTSG